MLCRSKRSSDVRNGLGGTGCDGIVNGSSRFASGDQMARTVLRKSSSSVTPAAPRTARRVCHSSTRDDWDDSTGSIACTHAPYLFGEMTNRVGASIAVSGRATVAVAHDALSAQGSALKRELPDRENATSRMRPQPCKQGSACDYSSDLVQVD